MLLWFFVIFIIIGICLLFVFGKLGRIFYYSKFFFMNVNEIRLNIK